MHQPESLRSQEYRHEYRGRACDVWETLFASAAGDVPHLRRLLARDPGLARCEFEYRQPLHLAICRGQEEAVKLLLVAGAESTQAGLQTGLATAREFGHPAILDLLESFERERHGICLEGEWIAEAIRRRDGEAVRKRIGENPKSIDAADARGNRPIHWAVMTRQIPLIGFLLDHGANIDAQRPDGARPLHLTNGDYWYRGWRDVPSEAMRRHEVLIGYLLARGAAYDLATAAKIGDTERVRELLDEQPEAAAEVPAYSTYYCGFPLRRAAEAGHMAVVRLLLERGADPNQPEQIAPRGGALRGAIGGQHWDIVKLLLEHGADPNAMVDSSGNCVYAAQISDAPDEIRNLLAAHGGVLGIDIACYLGDVQTLGAMLHANPDLYVEPRLIPQAIENGHRPLIELLLRYQPHVLEQVDLPGVPDAEFVRWLLEHGLDPKRTNWLGATALHRLAGNGHIESAALCLEKGADLQAIDDEYSSTPLGWAARNGHSSMVRWLLDRGARPDLPDDRPWAQPAEWARRKKHGEVLQALRTS